MIAASATGATVAKPGLGQGTVWHTLRVRVRSLVAVAVVLMAAALVSSARARSSASATATAAVVSGSLGRVAPVKASGDASTSSSVTSRTPKGIELGDGFVSVTTSLASHSAQA